MLDSASTWPLLLSIVGLTQTDAVAAAASAEITALDDCADAQQLLFDFLEESVPLATITACASNTTNTSACALWTQQCQASATISECSVGCGRIPGCVVGALSPGSYSHAQPHHPHGIEATGAPTPCVPDSSQCVCPPGMQSLIETMYWSCEGAAWEAVKGRWETEIRKHGCSGASATSSANLLICIAIIGLRMAFH